MGPQPYDQALRAGAGGRAGLGTGGGLRQRPPLDPAQERGGDAVSPRRPHPLGQAAARGGQVRDTGEVDRGVMPANKNPRPKAGVQASDYAADCMAFLFTSLIASSFSS